MLAAGTAACWLATGANRGWTKTSVAVERTDEVTGIVYREYEKRFSPGVEFLGAGLGGAVLLAGAARFVGGRGRRAGESESGTRAGH